MASKYLVLTDVDAIQSYVFSSVRLAPIVGASQIIRESDGQLLGLAQGCIADESVCSGGVGLFVFQDEAKAQEFQVKVSREFEKWSGDGSLTVSPICKFTDATDGDSSFVSARNEGILIRCSDLARFEAPTWFVL